MTQAQAEIPPHRYTAELAREIEARWREHWEQRGTIDAGYYRWTQWIFLQIFNSWYDQDARRARPVSELIDEFASGRRPVPGRRSWDELTPVERRKIVDGYRLAYISEAPVNWCPGLGTVLAN